MAVCYEMCHAVTRGTFAVPITRRPEPTGRGVLRCKATPPERRDDHTRHERTRRRAARTGHTSRGEAMSDRTMVTCDRCPAQHVTEWLRGMLTIRLCGHHGSQHGDALEADGFVSFGRLDESADLVAQQADA